MYAKQHQIISVFMKCFEIMASYLLQFVNIMIRTFARICQTAASALMRSSLSTIFTLVNGPRLQEPAVFVCARILHLRGVH